MSGEFDNRTIGTGRQPKVTVLMPVHNGGRYLREAIDSILSQTFSDFEFLIIDDGSTDQSVETIESYNDPRIVLKRNAINRGTVHVLNDGLDTARGKYIVRMDCDDISLPRRIENQVRFMDANPEIGISGTGMQLIKKGRLRNTRTLPESDEELKISLLFHTCFFHPTVIIRTALAKGHPYPDDLVYTQDYNYWTDLARLTRFANLRETLLYFREHDGQLSSRKAELQVSNARLIRGKYLQEHFGSLSQEELAMHNLIAESRPLTNLLEAEAWLKRLIHLNDAGKCFPKELFDQEMSRRWWHVCKKNVRLGRVALQAYRLSELSKCYKPAKVKYLGFLIKCIGQTKLKQR